MTCLGSGGSASSRWSCGGSPLRSRGFERDSCALQSLAMLTVLGRLGAGLSEHAALFVLA